MRRPGLLSRCRPAPGGAALILAFAVAIAATNVTAHAAARTATVDTIHAANPAPVNLLVNGDAEAGAPSTSGNDSVTIPGWQAIGAPTVIAYGAPNGLPDASTPGPTNRGNAFYGGGKVATTSLSQTVNVSAAAAAIDASSAQYNLSGWLGGYRNDPSAAQVNITPLDTTGKPLGSGDQIGPVTHKDRADTTQFLQRATSGVLPAGTRSIKVVLLLTDGGIAGGYNNAYADDLSLTLSVPGPQPAPLTPPSSTVPGLDHILVIYMENYGRADIIGNTSQAPYINSLARQYAQASNYFAVSHPSDPNYLALAGGQTYGILTNCPTTCVEHATNIGDLLESAGKTWKGYEQNMPSPCYLQHSGSYYVDDLPFVYFDDIVNNPARCQSHLVPQSRLTTDLASSATTPNFSWIAADDYFDMEAGGITAGDSWLASTLPTIFNSPAWANDRTAIVLTWDEDGYGSGGTNQGNNVAALVIGSPHSGIKTGGYTSTTNYTHYSLLRTIEGALGLPAMTTNDAYAAPMNDFWN